MGRVFAATILGPDGFEKPAALKVLHPRGGSPESRALFASEARFGALVQHPHLVETYDYGWTGEEPWLALEWVRGCSLWDRLQKGPVAPEDTIRIGAAIAEGLAVLHRLRGADHPGGVVHRDLKPGNVLLGDDGRIKVSDFGLVRAAHGEDEVATRVIRGTPAYMAPEQARGDPLDGRADLFALGAILWEMATGRRFLEGRSHIAILQKLGALDGTLDDGGLLDRHVPGLRNLVGALLAPRREERPEDAGAVARMLGALSPGRGAAGVQAAPRPRIPADDATADVRAEATGSATREQSTRIEVPAPRDSFVGREQELLLLETWGLGEGAILTLLGPGGVGKTRLALAAAARLTGRFEGLHFIDLAGARDNEQMAAKTGAALSLGEGSRTVEGVKNALAGRGTTLLVLDNTEQIEGVGRAVSVWAGAGPVKILVTSRQPLGVRGERIQEIDPLPPEAGAALFVARAAAGPGGRTASTADPDLLRLVEALDGLPLAIELAAARARLLNPAQLLSRLGDRFRLLQGGATDGPDRHSALRATLDWSWDLLGPWERRALCTLSRFAGPFTLDAATAVLGEEGGADAPWPEDRLGALRDASLMRTTERGFALLSSVREYGWSRASPGEQLRIADVHALHWSSTPPQDDPPTFEARLADVENQADRLRAVSFFVEQGRFEEGAVVLAASARLAHESRTQAEHWALLRRIPADSLTDLTAADVFGACGTLLPAGEAPADRRRMLENAVARAGGLPPSATVERVHAAAARFALDEGRFSDADAHLKMALANPGPLADDGSLLDLQASLFWYRGETDAMLDAAHRALALARRNGRQLAIADRELLVGIAYAQVGDLDGARAHYESAAATSRRVGLRTLECVIINNLGVVDHQLGRLDEALAAYRKARTTGERLALRRVAAVARGNEGAHAHELGSLGAAVEHYAAARTTCKLLSLPRFEAWFGALGAGALWEAGRVEEAERWWAESQAAADKSADAPMKAALTICAGFAEVHGGNLAAAEARIAEQAAGGAAYRSDNARFAVRLLRAALQRRTG